MKPLTLEIAGLNSFRRRQTIEFGALLEDGLFGIFGPTGSGKSTILDAITLALYGRVKRAQGGKGGIINVREKSCSVRFTFEISSDGDRRRYSIERVLGRASGRTDGVQTKRARLCRFDDETEIPIAEKQGEIDAAILELLGIEYHEFMRAVVLPQGSFADFLALTPKERAGALQRLFGLHELGLRLGSRLRARGEQVRTTRAGIDGRLAELRAYDDDALVAVTARLAEAESVEARARLAFDRAASALAGAEELATLLGERRALEEQEAARGHSERELAGLRERIARSDRAASVSAVVAALERASERADSSRREHDAAIAAHRDAARRLVEARERFDEIRTRFTGEHDRLCGEIGTLESAVREIAALDERAGEAVGAEAERERLGLALAGAERSRDALRGQTATSETLVLDHEARLRSIEVHRDELDRLSQLQVATGRLRDRAALAAELDRKIVELTRDVEQRESEQAARVIAEQENGASLHPVRSELQIVRGIVEERTKERATIGERYMHLRGVLRQIEELEAQCAQHERVRVASSAMIEQQVADWTVVSHRFSGISERRAGLEVEREETAERLQDAYRRLAIATLSPQLRDDAPCPVCGSLEHPAPAHAAGSGDDELRALEREAQRLDKEIREATERITRCGQDMGTIESAKRHALETLRLAEDQLTATRAKLDRELAAASGEHLPLASSQDLERYMLEIENEGQSVRTHLDTATARVAELEELERGLTEASATNQRRCAELDAIVRARRDQLLDMRNDHSKLASEIDELRANIAERSGGRSAEQVDADVERMRASDRAAQHLRDVIDNERRKIAMLRAELATVEEAYREAAGRFAAADSVALQMTAEIRRARNEIESRVVGLRCASGADLSIDRLLDERIVRRDQIALERGDADVRHNEAMSNERVAAALVEHTGDAAARDEAERTVSAAECVRALATAGFATLQEARDAAIDAEETERVAARIAALEGELRSLTSRLEDNRRRIAGRSLGDGELEDIRARHEAARRALEAAIGEVAAAASDTERTRERNAEYHRFSDENAGVIEREQTIEQLGRYLHGDAFVNFLADERLTDVCRRASRTLEELTGGRFEIFSRPDEGFMVRDMGNGGIDRAPNSLSGGETFVVSLALALALSDTIQLGRAPLEFFFLDEGFGTLDAELLDTVVDTLERLRSRHRTIGLITHVGTLRERIPRRLVVSPPADGTGSVVEYEIA